MSDQKGVPAGAVKKDKARAKRVDQVNQDFLTSSNIGPLALLPIRPDPPRSLFFRAGVLTWTEPKETRNVDYYNIYLDDDSVVNQRVPVGQTSARPMIDTATRVWVSAVNLRSGQESTKAYTTMLVIVEQAVVPPVAPPPPPVTPGVPGTIAFDPYLPEIKGEIGVRNVVLTGKADEMKMTAWYVDEPETGYFWCELRANMDDSTDPVTVSVNVNAPAGDGNGNSTDPTNLFVPRVVAGDLLVINDPETDPNHGSFRKYEVVRVDEITGDTGAITMKLSRHEVGYDAPFAYLKSYRSSHLVGTRMYRLKRAHYPIPTKDSLGYTKIADQSFTLLSSCVVAVAMSASDLGTLGAWTLKNCSQIEYPFPGSERQNPPAPGMRTCNGAEYDLAILGPIIALTFLQVPMWVCEPASIRGLIAECRIKPVGFQSVYKGLLQDVPSASMAGYCLYVEPKIPSVDEPERRVAVIEQFAITNGNFDSFTGQYCSDTNPDVRRTPQHLLWPCTLFPVVGTLGAMFDMETGLPRDNLFPLTAGPDSIPYQEGGRVFPIVERAGLDVSGFDLTTTLLT